MKKISYTLQRLREKIIEAKYPEPEYGAAFRSVYEQMREKYPTVFQVGLTDVLRAMPNKSLAINGIGVFLWDYEGEVAKDTGGYWNLSASLDDQSPGTIDFLYKIICGV